MDKKYGQSVSHVSCTGTKYTYHDYFINSFKYIGFIPNLL